MGSGSFDTQSYTRSFADSQHRSKSVAQTFERRSIDLRFAPNSIVMRESCDSETNPNSTPLIIGLDVTGSMGMIPQSLLTGGGLGRLMEHIYLKKTITDPQIMTVAIGDIECDRAPLQATQFESDTRIAEQLKDIYIEQGGGGNGTESYDLPWLFAAARTTTDSFKKRNKKGYLFTIGDEGVPRGATQSQLRNLFNTTDFGSLSASQMLAMAQEKWNCFHILCEETGFASMNLPRLKREWDALMGRHVLYLKDYKLLPELIIATLEIEEGRSMEEVLESAENDHVREVLQHAFA